MSIQEGGAETRAVAKEGGIKFADIQKWMRPARRPSALGCAPPPKAAALARAEVAKSPPKVKSKGNPGAAADDDEWGVSVPRDNPPKWRVSAFAANSSPSKRGPQCSLDLKAVESA